ncbi:uncharacterized protein LOC110116431 isoform X2 [Dendrobium catenatum]|uniref:Essential protein Yae1 N-terminal domain-containing protein n=1 Tax=Dendrobium nobile TaxID=94219 RepID=A0A8T3B495_DENNO|nr:uncharacterized protein LOC110116431 isoform X2 [Dendrobium catenatum]XP_020705652.1 uncharacterized protein LOC110116431 isoform X2 [Dendrobium catenatum]KAI0504304.1 hypothetical protein KFK09_015256 [Dendrobium nobile]
MVKLIFVMGFRDGISAGKEASAQEGFNHGFRESVYAGYSWGLVRGISSVISTLPDHLKEKLTSNQQNKERFQKLYESTRAISSNKALQIFYSSIQQNGSGDSHELCEDSRCNQLDVLSKDLNDLLRDSVELKVDLGLKKDSAING